MRGALLVLALIAAISYAERWHSEREREREHEVYVQWAAAIAACANGEGFRIGRRVVSCRVKDAK